MFRVNPNQQGIFADFLKGIDHFDLSDRLPLEENQPADVVFPDDSFDFFLVLLVFIAVYGNHKELSDFFVQSHGAQRLFGPVRNLRTVSMA